MNRAEYREMYLRSAHWLEQREAALERAGYRCQVCNGAKRLDVHHRTYERLGNEDAMDLTVLCRKCHDLFHASRSVVKTSAAKAKKRQAKKAARSQKAPKHARLSTTNELLHELQVSNKRKQDAARAARQPRITVPME